MWAGLLRGWRSLPPTGPPSWKSIVLSKSAVRVRREAIWTGTHSPAQVEPWFTDQHDDLTVHLSVLYTFFPQSRCTISNVRPPGRASCHPATADNWPEPCLCLHAVWFAHINWSHNRKCEILNTLAHSPTLGSSMGRTKQVRRASGASSSRMFQRGTHINRRPLHSWPDKAPSASIQKLRRWLLCHYWMIKIQEHSDAFRLAPFSPRARAWCFLFRRTILKMPVSGTGKETKHYLSGWGREKRRERKEGA